MFEEASGILSSYAAKSASSSESFIQYLGVDPQKNDKQKYGLEGEATAPLQIDASGAALAPDTAKIENLELHVKREKHWLRRIQESRLTEIAREKMRCWPMGASVARSRISVWMPFVSNRNNGRESNWRSDRTARADVYADR